MSGLKSDRTIDTSGQCCPVPMIETNRAVKQMQSGEVLEVICTDIGSKMDLSAWCQRTGNPLIEMHQEGEKIFRFFIRKR